jgi:hypothetical protein
MGKHSDNPVDSDDLRVRRSASRTRPDRAAWGRIGGLTTGARHGGEAMTKAARRGFQRRFEHEVDPDGRLEPRERERRAERARRAHMLRLARASAVARAGNRDVARPSDGMVGSRRRRAGF